MATKPAGEGTALTPLRERKKQLTTQRIHEAALDFALERGAASVTIEEICERALVSTRTFFNYYASKTAAMLGIPNLAVSEEQRETFLASTGTLLDDLCILVARIAEDTAIPRTERARLKRLFTDDPEVAYEMFSAMRALRCELRELILQRAEPREAAIVAALVFAALPLAYMAEGAESGPEQLRTTIARMCSVGR